MNIIDFIKSMFIKSKNKKIYVKTWEGNIQERIIHEKLDIFTNKPVKYCWEYPEVKVGFVQLFQDGTTNSSSIKQWKYKDDSNGEF